MYIRIRIPYGPAAKNQVEPKKEEKFCPFYECLLVAKHMLQEISVFVYRTASYCLLPNISRAPFISFKWMEKPSNFRNLGSFRVHFYANKRPSNSNPTVWYNNDGIYYLIKSSAYNHNSWARNSNNRTKQKNNEEKKWTSKNRKSHFKSILNRIQKTIIQPFLKARLQRKCIAILWNVYNNTYYIKFIFYLTYLTFIGMGSNFFYG